MSSTFLGSKGLFGEDLERPLSTIWSIPDRTGDGFLLRRRSTPCGSMTKIIPWTCFSIIAVAVSGGHRPQDRHVHGRDKGQMDLYLAWLKEHDWRAGENEPVGLILCTSARRQHVELLLRHGPHKMKVAEYLTVCPTSGSWKRG